MLFLRDGAVFRAGHRFAGFVDVAGPATVGGGAGCGGGGGGGGFGDGGAAGFGFEEGFGSLAEDHGGWGGRVEAAVVVGEVGLVVGLVSGLAAARQAWWAIAGDLEGVGF